MDRRLELHEHLVEAAGEGVKVYFQPPSNLQMTYPCITYERARVDVLHASNENYKVDRRYTVTVVDRNPDSPILDRMLSIPMCSHSTYFSVDGLNHDVYDVYI